LHNTFSPSKRDSENKAENKQTNKLQKIHKTFTNKPKKTKGSSSLNKKNYTNFITKNSQ
jgi:hypothetical protein